MNALVKKQQKNDNTTSDNTALLSVEILNSLLIRFKMIMDERLKGCKAMLKNFLVEKNLNFLHECCASSVQDLVQLVVFFDLPLNYINEPLNLESINLIQFTFEIKNRLNVVDASSDFMIALWNILKN